MSATAQTYDIDRFYADLVEHGLIIPSDIQGGYGRGAVFEDILNRFNDLVSRIAKDDGAEPVMSLRQRLAAGATVRKNELADR